MPAQLTTKAQVNGYRFLLRRLDHALVRRDVRMLHDPMRSQVRSLWVGAVLGLLVVAGAAILSFIRPQGSIGDAKIVTAKDSGAMYVVVEREDGKTLHPILNLASARLIHGSGAETSSVKDSKLADLPRGPMLGIPGAPSSLPGSAGGDSSEWALCETVQAPGGSTTPAGTTVVAGTPDLGDRIEATGAETALLAERGARTYLIYDGKRAEVDTTDSVTARSLGLSAHRPRSIGTGLLGTTTEVPPLRMPDIPESGRPGPGALSDVPVGGIVSVPALERGAEPDMYVVLPDGVQPVTPFAAEMIRNADSQGMSEIKAMPPDVLEQLPVVNSLPLGHFPEQAPQILDAKDAPVACLAWSKTPGTGPAGSGGVDGPAERAKVSLLAGTRLPIEESAAPVELATGDGTGDRVDAVYLPPSSGELVQVTGMEPGSPRRSSLFYVADNGIRYGIPDMRAARMLGLGDEPNLAPWAIIGQLVPGPTLSTEAALVSHDSLPTGDQ